MIFSDSFRNVLEIHSDRLIEHIELNICKSFMKGAKREKAFDLIQKWSKKLQESETLSNFLLNKRPLAKQKTGNQIDWLCKKLTNTDESLGCYPTSYKGSILMSCLLCNTGHNRSVILFFIILTFAYKNMITKEQSSSQILTNTFSVITSSLSHTGHLNSNKSCHSVSI